MGFINMFKYGFAIAHIIKIISTSETRVPWHNYDDYFTNNDRIDDESPTDAYFFDYNVVVEYRCKNKTYQRNMLIKNTIKQMNIHSKILVYYERKNPLNVYIF